MTRNGKLARLPHAVREELNRRLRDGEPGGPLLEWLNAREDVQAVLREHFDGQPVNKQNLSDWRLGGHRDWLRHQESLALVQALAEQGEELVVAARGEAVSDRLAAVLAVELAREVGQVLDGVTDPAERSRQLAQLRRELAELRRDDHRAARLRLERWEQVRQDEEREQAANEKELREIKERTKGLLWSVVELGPLAKLYGGGERGREWAARVLENRYDLAAGTLSPKRPAGGPESSPVKPGQGGGAPGGGG